MGAILVEMTPLDPCRLTPSLEPDPLLCRRGPSTQEPCLRGSLLSPPAIDTRLDPCPCPILRPSSTACMRQLSTVSRVQLDPCHEQHCQVMKYV